MSGSPGGLVMNISFEDGKRLRSVMWNKEQLIAKKRRLLMGSAIATTPKGSQRMSNLKIDFPTDLYLLESYVRNGEVSSETVRTTVESSFSCRGTGCHRVIQDYLRLFQVHDQENNSLKQLPNVTNTRDHRCKEQFVRKTPNPRFCLTSINNMLEELDEMSCKELQATDRKLRGISVIPKFPPRGRSERNRVLLLERIKKRFQGFLSNLNDGDELPEQLSKALSVIYLSVKHRSRHIDVLTSEFCPFSPEIAELQNDIVQALWLLPKFKYDQLRDLQALLDPKAEVSVRCLRNALRTYLIECLIECHETNAAQGLLRTLDFINGRISPVSKKDVQQDIEVVMILSCQLKQVISSPFSYQSDDEKQFLDDFKNDEKTDAFNLAETDYFLRSGDNESCSNYEDGVIEHTRQGISTSITTINSSFLLSQAANERSGSILKGPDFEHDHNIDMEKPCVVDSVKLGLESTSQITGNVGVKSVQEAFDETALVAYKLVGSMLDKLLKIEGINAGVSARSYLNGGLLDPPDLQGLEDMLTSKENAPSQIFIQTVKETLPSLAKSSIRRVENLLGELPSQ